MNQPTQRGVIANIQYVIASLAQMIASFAGAGTKIGHAADTRASYFDKLQDLKGAASFADQLAQMKEDYKNVCPEVFEKFGGSNEKPAEQPADLHPEAGTTS